MPSKSKRIVKTSRKPASKPATKAATKRQVKSKPVAAAPKQASKREPKPERKRHEIKSTYAGASKPFNKSPQADRTVIRARTSAEPPSGRTNSIVLDLATKYGSKPFQRNDSGDDLNRPLFWGFVVHVSGDTGTNAHGETTYSPDSVFKLANPRDPLKRD